MRVGFFPLSFWEFEVQHFHFCVTTKWKNTLKIQSYLRSLFDLHTFTQTGMLGVICPWLWKILYSIVCLSNIQHLILKTIKNGKASED